jgi:uracil phosphoribosyltransferase
MQVRSYFEDAHPRLQIHPSRQADDLKEALLLAASSPPRSTMLLSQIGTIFLRSLVSRSKSEKYGAASPIIIMRGGLLLWESARRIFDSVPSGVLIPLRAQHLEMPKVIYGCVPSRGVLNYLLLDMLIASGRTMTACASAIVGRTAASDPALVFGAPFVARVGWEALLAQFPAAEVHCIWHNEEVDSDGRMVGPGFDVGEYVFGAADSYTVWGGQ